MRATLSISDELLEAARRRGRETGQTLGAVVEAALRRELAAGRQPGQRPKVPTLSRGTGPRPGLDLSPTAALHAALDEDSELTDLR